MERKGDPDTYVVTDLLDERTLHFRVQYPITLLAELIVVGIFAFTSIAYFGYPGDPTIFGSLLHNPWPVYVWFCMLYLVLQVSVLRHPRLRPYLTSSLVASLLSTTLIGGAWYTSPAGRSIRNTALANWVVSRPLLLLLVIAAGTALLVALSVRLPVLRYVLAWLLTVLGVIGLLAGAEFTGLYMHTASRTPVGDPRLAFGQSLIVFLEASASVVGAFIAAAMSFAILLFSVRVFTNTMRFLLFLPVFAYVYFPVFAVINSIIWLSGLSFRTPFFQPSVSGLIGIAVFVATGGRTALSWLNQLRGIEPRGHVVAT